jgi:hypothetical protein
MLDCNYLVSKYPRDFSSSMLLDLAEMLRTLLLEPPNLSIPIEGILLLNWLI